MKSISEGVSKIFGNNKAIPDGRGGYESSINDWTYTDHYVIGLHGKKLYVFNVDSDKKICVEDLPVSILSGIKAIKEELLNTNIISFSIMMKGEDVAQLTYSY